MLPRRGAGGRPESSDLDSEKKQQHDVEKQLKERLEALADRRRGWKTASAKELSEATKVLAERDVALVAARSEAVAARKEAMEAKGAHESIDSCSRRRVEGKAKPLRLGLQLKRQRRRPRRLAAQAAAEEELATLKGEEKRRRRRRRGRERAFIRLHRKAPRNLTGLLMQRRSWARTIASFRRFEKSWRLRNALPPWRRRSGI